jgi:hypothetical protein
MNPEPNQIGGANSRCAHSFVRDWFHKVIVAMVSQTPAAVAHLVRSAVSDSLRQE